MDFLDEGMKNYKNGELDKAIENLSQVKENDKAEYIIGCIHIEKKKPEQALPFFLSSYNRGNIDSIYMLGHIYCDWEPMRNSEYEKGLEYFKEAHEKGDFRGTYRYALTKLHGNSVQEWKEGYELLEYGDKNGNIDCSKRLGVLLTNGDGGIEADILRAVSIYENMAEKGYSSGMIKYAFSKLVEKNKDGMDIVKKKSEDGCKYATSFLVSQWLERNKYEDNDYDPVEVETMFRKAELCYKNVTMCYTELNDFLKYPNYADKIYNIYLEEYENDKSNPKAKVYFKDKVADIISCYPENLSHFIAGKLIDKLTQSVAQ